MTTYFYSLFIACALTTLSYSNITLATDAPAPHTTTKEQLLAATNDSLRKLFEAHSAEMADGANSTLALQELAKQAIQAAQTALEAAQCAQAETSHATKQTAAHVIAAQKAVELMAKLCNDANDQANRLADTIDEKIIQHTLGINATSAKINEQAQSTTATLREMERHSKQQAEETQQRIAKLIETHNKKSQQDLDTMAEYNKNIQAQTIQYSAMGGVAGALVTLCLISMMTKSK